MQDIIRGLKHNKRTYIVLLIFAMLISIGNCFEAEKYGSFTSVGIVITYLLRGIPMNMDLETFVVPTKWIVQLLFVPYVLGDYIEQDLKGIGIQRIIRIGRNKWWFSKWMWMFISMCIYYAIIVGIQMLMAYIYNGMTLGNPDMDVNLAGWAMGELWSNRVYFVEYVLILPLLTIMALGTWTLLLNLVFKANRSTVIMITYITLGAYIARGVFISNQWMLIRTRIFNGIYTFKNAFILDVCLIISGVLIGMIYLEGRDFLD